MSSVDMNCLAYRRALLATAEESTPMRAHRVRCQRCAGFFADHRAMEDDLRRALEVPVPSGLETRLVEHVFTADRIGRPDPQRRRWVLGVAAGMAGLLAVGAYRWTERDDPLALACIQWVIKEEAKSIMMGAMPHDEAVRALAGTLPLERIERVGKVRHIAPCPFNDSTAYHVVMSVGEDKVTLLVIPDGAAARRARATHEGIFAAVVPLAKGSVGIVANDKTIVTRVAGEIAVAAA